MLLCNCVVVIHSVPAACVSYWHCCACTGINVLAIAPYLRHAEGVSAAAYDFNLWTSMPLLSAAYRQGIALHRCGMLKAFAQLRQHFSLNSSESSAFMLLPSAADSRGQIHHFRSCACMYMCKYICTCWTDCMQYAWHCVNVCQACMHACMCVYVHTKPTSRQCVLHGLCD